MRSSWLLSFALALAGCQGKPEPPVDTRPEWTRAAIDGIAPLMSPQQVAAALTQHGYVQIPCTSKDTLLVDPLDHGDDSPCYQAPDRPMRVSLFFLDLIEGRRLAVVNFGNRWEKDESPATLLAAGGALARQLRSRFGPPFTSSSSPDFQTFYWRRPGGQASLPDMVSTTVGKHFGRNVTMTSMWAYGQQRPRP
ncbi:hypothetical protein C8J45_11349 [Sphingomonas sp. PP-CE-3G-477]|uniref:hypothetical protein n=1 Tax=Sphingomonas sp. PP-CE-3G-477 TaxID=2135660 RepID=UPI000D37C5D3|nr:hypothetical protein [Sphingomonas sp. PP-CE-3G-477]PTQ60098.1 hypothetical protein C8J45_11349 [Sphingomonas sp. PP-CE-3G-477]